MIKILNKIDRSIYVAVSGGIDSMAILSFLKRNHNIKVLYFNHGTEYGNIAEKFLINYCENNSLLLLKDKIKNPKKNTLSLEEYWRNERYNFLDQFSDAQILTGHHLDDAIEWWLFTSFNGLGKLLNYKKNNIIRPFLLTEKKDLISWVNKNNVPFIEDDSNKNISFARNRIRHNIIPEVLNINPGIKKNIKKLLLAKYGNKN